MYLTFVGFFILAVVVVAVIRAYSLLSTNGLKRKASQGDDSAQILYQVIRQRRVAHTILWLVVLLLSAFSIFLAVNTLPGLVSVAYVFGLLLVVFVALPNMPSNKFSRWLSFRIAPWLSHILVWLRPAYISLPEPIKRRWSITDSAKLYEKEDLLELLITQKKSTHNRIEVAELDMALNALSFGEKQVKDFMVPKRAVHFVDSEEPIGPILMGELYESGLSYFPVKKETKDQIVGTLYLKDLVKKHDSGIVSNVMVSEVAYMPESASLEEVLGAFLKTKNHLFIAVNDAEKVVGAITIEIVIEQILGRKIIDELR